ncbi:MAG: hypothetical protein AABW67_04035 [Nanoarchaeota archaeon]
MGIFDFFRKKPIVENKQEIKFEDIDNWIFSEKERINLGQQAPKKQIKYALKTLVEEIEIGLPALKKIDLKERKEHERAKLIVLENLDKFVHLLERLIQDLKIISEKSLEELVNKINLTFSKFDKQSSMNFQKATFLVGKELEVIQQRVYKFFSEFNKIIKENEQEFKRGKLVLEIEGELSKFKKEEKTIEEILSFIEDIKEQINQSEKNIKEHNKKINLLKNTEEYIKQSKHKQELENLKKDFVKQINSLKDSIDFKLLNGVYHSIENQMKIIKEFKENFKEALEKYGEDEFLELVDIKEINQGAVKEKLEEIDKIKGEIEEKINQFNLNEDITEKLEKELNYLNNEIKDRGKEILENEKKIKKIDENKKMLKDKIMEKVNDI